MICLKALLQRGIIIGQDNENYADTLHVDQNIKDKDMTFYS